MAESKSTLIKALASSSPAVIEWSSLASAANNVYFDVGNADASKLIILVANTMSSGITATCGKFYIGTSDSAATGSSKAYPYSASKLHRMELISTAVPTKRIITTGGTEGLTISVFGPFETARFKSSQGYVKFAKRRAAGDAGKVKVAGILIP